MLPGLGLTVVGLGVLLGLGLVPVQCVLGFVLLGLGLVLDLAVVSLGVHLGLGSVPVSLAVIGLGVLVGLDLVLLGLLGLVVDLGVAGPVPGLEVVACLGLEVAGPVPCLARVFVVVAGVLVLGLVPPPLDVLVCLVDSHPGEATSPSAIWNGPRV